MTHTAELALVALLFASLFLVTLLGLASPAHADPDILYAAPAANGSGVCSSWANACTLQTALANAVSGDQIWVQAGVHKPTTTTDRTVSFDLQRGMAVYGGFAGTETALDQRDPANHITVLSGDIDNNDTTDPYGVVTDTANLAGNNSYHVVTSSGVTETAVLDGFTITAGQASYPASQAYYGGGMYNDNASPRLTNVILWGNTATIGDTQIYNINTSTPTISYSDIQGCGGSGAGWDPNLGTDGGGNIDGNPLFVDAARGNLRLQIGSPAIDAGNNISVTVSTDLDGSSRFVDIPTMPDTGNGTPPIVDMGAYEVPQPSVDGATLCSRGKVPRRGLVRIASGPLSRIVSCGKSPERGDLLPATGQVAVVRSARRDLTEIERRVMRRSCFVLSRFILDKPEHLCYTGIVKALHDQHSTIQLVHIPEYSFDPASFP